MKKILLLALISSNFIFSQSFVPNAPELNLKSYILIDPNTNTVIAEANSEGQIEPASMTKVMTAYVVADQIKNGLISLEIKFLLVKKHGRWVVQKCLLRSEKKLVF
jgi:D-alanyl-D-alanine carboxypeptidase (penicillin-binding protein 5/6)